MSNETMRLLGSNKNVISKDSETSENVPKLEILDAVLMQTIINNYQNYYSHFYQINNLDK